MKVYRGEFSVLDGMQDGRWWCVEMVANCYKYQDCRKQMCLTVITVLLIS